MSEMKRMQNPICQRLPVFQQSKQKLTMMMSSDRWQRKDAIFGVVGGLTDLNFYQQICPRLMS